MGRLLFLILGLIMGIGSGVVLTCHYMMRDIKRKNELASKQVLVAQMLNQWLKIKQGGKSIAEYLSMKGYCKVAIYGMNYLGERLLEDLEDSEIIVAYTIDKGTKSAVKNVKCYTPEERLSEVDAVIVSVNYYFDEIKNELSPKIDYPILNLEEILYDI